MSENESEKNTSSDTASTAGAAANSAGASGSNAENTSYYAALGLPDNASIDNVKSRYGALLRAYKQRTAEKGETYEDIDYRNKITYAYDHIMGISYNFEDDNPSSKIPLKVRRFFGKLATIFDTYKLAFFIGAAVILLVTVFIIQLATGTKYDVAVKFVGAYYTQDETSLIQKFNENSESTESAQISWFTVTTDTNIYDSGAKSQATTFLSQLMAGTLDVVLIDKESFDVYVSENAFLALDDYISQFESENGLISNTLYRYEKEAESESDTAIPEGVYGIEVSDSKFFDDIGLSWLYDEEAGQEKTMIFAICRTSKNADLAWKLGTDILLFGEKK